MPNYVRTGYMRGGFIASRSEVERGVRQTTMEQDVHLPCFPAQSSSLIGKHLPIRIAEVDAGVLWLKFVVTSCSFQRANNAITTSNYEFTAEKSPSNMKARRQARHVVKGLFVPSETPREGDETMLDIPAIAFRQQITTPSPIAVIALRGNLHNLSLIPHHHNAESRERSAHIWGLWNYTLTTATAPTHFIVNLNMQ
ncbi:hypothetical protein BGZ61DRAFT_487340 [Ilyonectria robusta]|uniref:uncharacterized protein n=1 Tax=Ilyonectria robusta TaxID=1079257 RepID=UPI001E8DFCB9|nr:uncharacterized protein BGZ61DRAFT_487340 [Ilyonectria robusta]KAH8652984.1 hypothetical protein BGZ61DRAFT_487340 [Ilyonectria robusta]